MIFKEKKPLVSIIIPNYNYARYLDERLESILNQTFQNFEIIILDDKSTDESIEVIEKYRGNPHISYIIYNEENSGSTFKQWHKGLLLAKGELIWIAESDDKCEPNLLEKLVREFRREKDLVLAFSLTRLFWDDGKIFDIPSLDTTLRTKVKGRKFIRKYMADGCYITNASSALFLKNTALSIAPNYTEFKSCGDRLFWIEIAEKGSVAIINERLNYCRRHPSTVTNKNTLNGVRQVEGKRIMEYLTEKGLVNKWEKLKYSSRYIYGNIYLQEFDNETTRQRLLKIWHVGLAERTYISFLRIKAMLSKYKIKMKSTKKS